MSVLIGSARIDENGKAHGGRAGDQTGKEVSTQAWYGHGKGWRVLRAVDTAAAERIALCMERVCANGNIGYDQYQRDTLYNAAKQLGFDCGRVTEPVETDCSALVRVCMAFAGIMVSSFRTTNQAQVMLASGRFMELTGTKYTDSSDYLKRGDVLVTRSQGHTVVVLSDGEMSDGDEPQPEAGFDLGDRLLKKGATGPDVQEMQTQLISMGYTCGSYGADGKFGSATEGAVKAFQKDAGLEADGEFGPLTYAALLAAQAEDKPAEPGPEPAPSQPTPGTMYTVTGNTVWLWDGHPDHGGQHSGIARKDEMLIGLNARGYMPVVTGGTVKWISGKYLKEA